MASNYNYPGQELQLFEEARNWKKYFASKLIPFINGSVLEVGAGIGETTSFLLNKNIESWTCLEPDEKLFSVLLQKIKDKKLPQFCTAIKGILENLPADEKFDTIIYIDVLEHIENDKAEIEKAVLQLTDGGNLIILSPSFEILYSPFDKAIGHYRRYTKKTLKKVVASKHLSQTKMFYLESAGMLLLLLNKFLFKQKYPSQKNIFVWDKFFIPLSKLIDKISFYSFGKTIIGVWKYKSNKSE
jgi:ubiquinone/menaquinone biosynthesis C-methylase UbiE